MEETGAEPAATAAGGGVPRSLVIFGIALVGLCATSILHVIQIFSRGELAAKPAGAMLQGAEFDDRGNRERGPVLRRIDRYALLGIPGVGEPLEGPTAPPASTRGWIILNEYSRDRAVRRLNPYSRYELSCPYVDRLQMHVPDVDDYAMVYLRSICRG